MLVDAVIVAAGSATRFGGDKLLATLGGRPVLAWSIAAFARCPAIARIVVVATRERHERVAALAAREAPGRVAVVEGGERRRDSVEAGLRACQADYAAVHDGARPLVTGALIERVVAASRERGAAIAATPVTDTLKTVKDGLVLAHLERSTLRAAQTPQCVLREAWFAAAALSSADETDDAAMIARLGLDVAVVDGDPANIKVTMPWDIALAEAILREREGAA